MTRALIIGEDARTILRTLKPIDTAYYLDLVSRADAHGQLIDHALTTATRLNCSHETISRSRTRLEEAGLLLRRNFPHRGVAGLLTVYRSLQDQFLDVSNRAWKALAAARRTKREARAAARAHIDLARAPERAATQARQQGLIKVDQADIPLIPKDGEGAQERPSSTARHRFAEGGDGGTCAKCGFPAPNRRFHR